MPGARHGWGRSPSSPTRPHPGAGRPLVVHRSSTSLCATVSNLCRGSHARSGSPTPRRVPERTGPTGIHHCEEPCGQLPSLTPVTRAPTHSCPHVLWTTVENVGGDVDGRRRRGGRPVNATGPSTPDAGRPPARPRAVHTRVARCDLCGRRAVHSIHSSYHYDEIHGTRPGPEYDPSDRPDPTCPDGQDERGGNDTSSGAGRPPGSGTTGSRRALVS